MSVLISKNINLSENQIVKTFNQLKSQFYENIELLKLLRPKSSLYHEIYSENESILKQVHQINQR